MAEDEEFPRGNLRLYGCAICGRKFNQESLRKHQSICQKTQTKKRKIFDSGKQRADGSDVQYDKTRETKQVQIYGEKADDSPRRSDWRQKHNELIKAIRQARDVTKAIKSGGPLPAFQPSAIPSDYVQCQYCGRHFNSGAAERHIPFCETQHKRQKINNSANQRAKVDSRTKYQAPLPGQRKQSSEMSNGYGYGSGRPTYGGNNYNTPSGGGPRRPVRYDSNTYTETNNNNDNRVVYAIRNKSTSKANGRDDQLLRTGRNYENDEINTLARKRSGNGNSQKSSPMNSRTTSTKSLNRRSPSPGAPLRYANSNKPSVKYNNGHGHGGGTSKFCVECGTQFPVEWAKFCCLCGEKRT